MANSWYISQPLWNALPTWQASTTYTLGQIVRPATAFQYDNKCSYVVTTAGTTSGSEPTWNTNNNGTVTDGGVVWTNVTGQGAYGWSAPAGSFATLNTGYDIQLRFAGGDVAYIDSNSNETNVPNNSVSRNALANLPVRVYSVNASGSVPPTNTDYLPGASFDFANVNVILDTNFYYYGISFLNASYFYLTYNGLGMLYIRDCVLSQASSQTYTIIFDNATIHVILDNTQVIPYTGNTTQYLINLNQASSVFEWWNTSNPTNGYYVSQYPFTAPNGNWFHLKSVDLSGFTTTNSPNGLFSVNYQNAARFTLENCYLGMPVTNIAINQLTEINGNYTGEQPIIELINCYAGTENYNNNRFTAVGQLLTETDTALNGGATDGFTSFSHQITTSSYAGGKDTMQTMDGFPIFFNNTVVGTAQTAEIQVIATRQLTSDDIRVDLDYMSSSSYPQSQTLSTSPLLLPATNLATTSSTWTTGTAPSYVSYAATALQGNSYWTRTADTLASFSGNSNPCTVLVDNAVPFSPCYMEFQNQTWGSNQVAIGFIRSDYNSANYDPRNNSSFGYMMLIENGGVYGKNGNGPYVSLGSSISGGSIVRLFWDGKGNMAFALNNGLWNNVYNDASVASGSLVAGFINYSPVRDIVPFIEVKGGTASSWQIASDVTNCIYSPPAGSTYLPTAANTYITQKLSLSFTAQNIGLIRALVKVTSPVTQLWYDPSVSLT